MFKFFKKQSQRELPKPHVPNGEAQEAEGHMRLAMDSIHSALTSTRQMREATRRLQSSITNATVKK